jgi:lipid-binding SYLF domain-containing protein
MTMHAPLLRPRSLGLAAALLLFFLPGCGDRSASAASEQQDLIDHATTTVQILRREENFREPVASLLSRAKGVLIFPGLFKAGFILGGQGGSGVLVARGQDGSWGPPAFYTLGSGSIGLQIGAQASEVMFIIMTEGGLNKLLNNSMKFGADASVAVGPIGGGIQAATTANLQADIYAYSRAQGLFVGGAFEGSVINVREEWDRGYYGVDATARGIVIERRVSNPGTSDLQAALGAAK